MLSQNAPCLKRNNLVFYDREVLADCFGLLDTQDFIHSDTEVRSLLHPQSWHNNCLTSIKELNLKVLTL